MSCGAGRRCGSDLALLWLWYRLAAVALIRPLVWEPPCAASAALKRQKKKKKEEEEERKRKKERDPGGMQQKHGPTQEENTAAMPAPRITGGETKLG